MTEFPPLPALPLPFWVACVGVLALFFVLVAFSKSFRRLQLAAFLIPIGVIEFSFVGYYYASILYHIPGEASFFCFVTIISGIIIPILFAARSLLSKTVVRMLLFVSGWVEIAIGARALFPVWFTPSFFDFLSGIGLATVGIYSIVVSIFLSFANRSDIVLNDKELG